MRYIFWSSNIFYRQIINFVTQKEKFYKNINNKRIDLTNKS